MAYGYCTSEPAGLSLPHNCPNIAPAMPQEGPALSHISFGQLPTGPVASLQIAEQQDEAVGDGTTSVVVLAVELLKRGNRLVTAKIRPTSIIAGHSLAMRDACKWVQPRRGLG